MPFPPMKAKPGAMKPMMSGGMKPPMGGGMKQSPMKQSPAMAPPFRSKPQSARPPFGKMMADGGMNGMGMGAPAPIGGGGAPDAMPPAGAMGDADAGAEGVVKPEAVNYHDDPQNCQSCEYMGQDGQCAVLKMQVSPEGGCNAFEAKGGQGEDEGGMMPGEDGGGTDDGTSGYQQ